MFPRLDHAKVEMISGLWGSSLVASALPCAPPRLGGFQVVRADHQYNSTQELLDSSSAPRQRPGALACARLSSIQGRARTQASPHSTLTSRLKNHQPFPPHSSTRAGEVSSGVEFGEAQQRYKHPVTITVQQGRVWSSGRNGGAVATLGPPIWDRSGHPPSFRDGLVETAQNKRQ